MGLFITFEGIEGCGKTTQMQLLAAFLETHGHGCVLTREPGGTRLGERVRRYLKQTDETRISPLAELFLIATARAQLVSEIIRPELEKGKMVICDRFTPSTLAYQGYGRGLNTDALREVNDIATDGMSPDLIVLLDIPIEDGLGRKKSKERDRFESESLAFHARVRRGYLDMAKADPERWLVVDGRLPKKEIEKMIWGKVSILLKREPNG